MDRYKAALSIILVIAASPVRAGSIETPISASFLYAACSEAKKSEYSRGFCDGAIDALYSSLKNWCVPEDVTHGEVKKQIIKVLLMEGASSSKHALEFVGMAVHRKWPCR